MHARIVPTAVLLALAAAPNAVAVSPAAKTFTITGSAPMQAIDVGRLVPANAKRTTFNGSAALRLADSSSVTLVAKLRKRGDTGLYAFKSLGSGLPKFKGKITTAGEPESVSKVALALTRGTNDRVKDVLAAGVTAAPSATTTTLPSSPFVGELTGTVFVAAGRNSGLKAKLFIVVGDNGVAGAAAELNGGPVGCIAGTADLVTGAIALGPLSQQLTGDLQIFVQARAGTSSVTGSGTFTDSNPNKPSKSSNGSIRITGGQPVTSAYVGVYFGTLDLTGGPDSPDQWPVQLFVLNDGTAGGDTFDPDGNGFSFIGTADLATGAFTLPLSSGKQSFNGVTGNVSGALVTASAATGTFSLSNGDSGTISLPKVAP